MHVYMCVIQLPPLPDILNDQCCTNNQLSANEYILPLYGAGAFYIGNSFTWG